MRFLSLFAGIGGIDLGLERAGMTCVGQVEIDPFCRKVLQKHWPHVWRHDDVRTLTAEMIHEHCGPVHLIAGGFPCQDISLAGKGAGLDGERSGLYREIMRLIDVVGPRYVFMENVSALLGRGMGTVLADLAGRGMDAQWDCIPAAAIGAPHLRNRVFIVAYPNANGQRLKKQHASAEPEEAAQHHWIFAFDANGIAPGTEQGSPEKASGGGLSHLVRRFGGYWRSWGTEPDVDRVAHGVPDRLDRLRGLGNAVVPQIAEWIGRRIMRCDQALNPPVSAKSATSDSGGRWIT